MAHIESKLQPHIDRLSTVYYRYVDDTFVIANSHNDFTELFNHFNSCHPNIKVTKELEVNRSLPFLDVLVTACQDGTVKTAIFRKKTWTGLYLNYHSHVPKQYKIGLIKTLIFRARKICSPDTLSEELNTIKCTLIQNSYPVQLLQRYMDQTPPPKPYGPQRKTVFLKLSFISDKIS